MGIVVAGSKRAGGERPTLLEETWIEQGGRAHREERRREERRREAPWSRTGPICAATSTCR